MLEFNRDFERLRKNSNQWLLGYFLAVFNKLKVQRDAGLLNV